MTKVYRVSVVIAALVISVFLITSGLIIKESVNSKTNELSQLYTRKEELLTQQQKLESFVNELNETLNKEIQRNENLSRKVDSASSVPVVTTPPSAPSTTSTSTTTTSTSRTTRAS